MDYQPAKTKKGHFKYHPYLKPLARQNRICLTPTEGLLWHLVLRRKNTGYRFLRQKPIGTYIMDFYCSELKLGIEVDGSSHNNTAEKDFEREIQLRQLGIKIIRYSDTQVEKQTENVYSDVLKQIEIRKAELNNTKLI